MFVSLLVEMRSWEWEPKHPNHQRENTPKVLRIRPDGEISQQKQQQHQAQAILRHREPSALSRDRLVHGLGPRKDQDQEIR